VRLLGVRVAGFVESPRGAAAGGAGDGPWGEWQLGLPPQLA
jgi:hypothetical protein